MSLISLSTEAAAEQITRSNYGWSTNLGLPAGTITYAFRASAPSYSGGTHSLISTFTNLSADQKTTITSALYSWSYVGNIDFSLLGPDSSNVGTMLFGNYRSSTDGSSAFAYSPGSSVSSSSAGDVWFNLHYLSNVSLSVGTWAYYVYLHEIGHAIGLEHPGDYDAQPNVTLSYAADAGYAEDSLQYTIMSYFGAENTGANHVYQGQIIYPSTPLLHDISAMQRLYGAKISSQETNTIYGFNATAGDAYSITSNETQRVFCVWDDGGIDTIDLSGYSNNQIINLASETFSSVGALTKNLSIAQGVVIENAIGGSGSDEVNGNPSDNDLRGNAGNDVINGLAGADTLIGSYGADTLDGGAGRDILNNDASLDDLIGGDGADVYTITNTLTTVEEAPGTEANLGRNVGLFDAAVEQRLQKFYMAYYGRPSDYDGTAYWKSTLANNLGGSELRMAGFFGNPLQTEFANLYGVNTTNPEFLDRVYLNLFNRVADTEGRAYWAGIIQGKVNAGMITDNARAEVVIQIMDGAQGSDAALIATKQANATVLSKWIAQLDADNAYGDANNTDGFAAARTWLSAVGSDESSTSPMNLLARYVLSDVLDAQAEDQIETTVSYTLPTAVEVIKATGTSAITLTGNAENNQLIGNGHGSTLTGGAGSDLFVVNTLPITPDRISDFVSGTDVLAIDITSLNLNLGAITVQMNTVSGTDAALVYNTTTGALSYDADGVGTQAATVLITLVGAPTVTTGDVWVV